MSKGAIRRVEAEHASGISSLSRPETELGTNVASNSDVILSAIPHPVVLVGEGNAIQFANAAAELFFQTSQSVLRRQTLDEIAPFGSPVLALISQVRRAGVSVNEYAVDLGTPKIGTEKLVDIYAGPMDGDDSQILLMLQQRSMAQMIESQLNHRGAARSVSGMAAVLAHEIKNPLSGIRGAAQLLESELSHEDRALTKLICDETDRICAIVDRMEVFGDERPLSKKPVNVHEVLDRVYAIALNGFGSHIEFSKQFDPSLPDLPGDQDKLIQAFLNLVKNAVEAIEPGRSDGRVVMRTAFRPGVRLSLPGSQARVTLPLMIEVEDNGVGLPDDLKPYLFDPFVTTKPSGTGLGLALVAKIIGDHGGTISVDKAERGTVFRVLLPVSEK